VSEPVEPAAEAAEPDRAAGEAATAGDSEAATAATTDGAAAVAAPEPPPAARRRNPFYLRGRRPRLPRSRRGLFALLLVLGGLGGVATFTAVSLIQWTETADFCGRCHTMAPELAAYKAGPHRDVACAECHVEPGIMGFVKAKLNGTRQLVEVVLGTFPAPVPPPDHANLPQASDTCQKCHDVSQTALAALKTRTEFAEDEANTKEFVGLLVRPGGGDVFNVDRSVHWHVLRNVTYATATANSATIDYIAATTPDGTINEYISQSKIRVAEDVQPDIAALKASERLVVMTCYDCHNRAGHAIPNPRTGVDQAMSTGVIDPSLPYVKREAMRILWASYPSDAAADAEADGLRTFYQLNYPVVASNDAAQINAAVDELKVLYRLTATPEMKVTAGTYPDNLGHTDFPGCFRCHDGGHFLVKDGVVTNQTIPFTCDTCHTFPQIGPAVASLPLGEPPATHTDKLWVFSHKSVATSVDPGGQSCGECHARDYCVNCHSTGAVTVDHNQMATNHAAVIRAQGNTACAYCHLPVYCARCHRNPVLPVTTPFLQGPTSSVGTPVQVGLAWPLNNPNSSRVAPPAS
jgi:nitrate/TMAO reductase-like tetraheme cytochrome c subunit